MSYVTAQEAYDGIVAYIEKQGGLAKDWYAGITSDVKERLFSDHNVSEENDWWIYFTCKSSESARNVEDALLEYGCDGGEGGGDESTTQVYAYLKTSTTDP